MSLYKKLHRWFHQFGSPKYFYDISHCLSRWTSVICIICFACCMLKQNRDLFYFWVCSRIYTLLWKDFSCFRRLILSLSWKSNDRGGLKFWTCLHATVLLAVKYSAELNKYILLVRVICEKYRFRGQSNVPRR